MKDTRQKKKKYNKRKKNFFFILRYKNSQSIKVNVLSFDVLYDDTNQ